MRARSRMSAMRPVIAVLRLAPPSNSSTACSAGSEFSSTRRRAAPKVDHAVADFRADRAAAAGHDNRLAADEGFEPAVVDLDAGAQQQVLDRDRGELHRLPAGVERRQLAHGEAELAGAHQHRFRPCLRRQRRGRQHDARDDGVAAGEIGDHALEVVDVAEHRHAADRLAAVGRATATRRRPARSS